MAQASGSRESSRRDDIYVQAGDLVIVFASRDKTPMPLTVTPGEHLSNMFGHFPHDDMIGMPYGSKMISKNQRGFVYLLRPTPELWTLALPHRTQILYAPDMSFISMKLNMGPGSRVIEAGTGSGSFSHVIARTVGRAGSSYSGEAQVPRNWRGLPNYLQQNVSRGRGQPRDLEDDNGGDSDVAEISAQSTGEPQSTQVKVDDAVPDSHGRLWSFEFHQQRAEKARIEFAAHGMDKVIVLNHRNVCKDGFGLQDAADAIFLDLPAPWEAVSCATQALRRNSVGRVCCFSPCIEQVLKTVSALTEHGFTDVETFESLVRTHESLTAVGPEPDIDEAISRIKVVEKRKEARRLVQIERARGQRSATDSGPVVESTPQKRKHSASPEMDPAPMQTSPPDAVVVMPDGETRANMQEGIAVTKKQARSMQLQTQQQQAMRAATIFSRPYHEVSLAATVPRYLRMNARFDPQNLIAFTNR